jgi:hypothetical protein
VVVVEWIVEARCWVLRNRAVDLRICGLVFLGHLPHRDLRVLVWWCGWGRPSPNCREGFLIWVCFPWVGGLEWWVVVLVGFPARILRTV